MPLVLKDAHDKVHRDLAIFSTGGWYRSRKLGSFYVRWVGKFDIFESSDQVINCFGDHLKVFFKDF